MSLSKQLLILFLACLITIVLAQTTINATEINSATATSTTTLISSSISSTLLPSSSLSSTLLPSASSTFSNVVPTSLSSSTTSNPPSSSTITNANAVPTVQSTGWNSNENEQAKDQQSWLRQNNRFVFVIFVGLVVLAILIWYIVRSIKGMRKRLEQENEAQLYMMQQASAPHQQQPPPRNDRAISELTQTPPPAYKTEENTPVHQATEHRS
ncbi:uncharacterized protein ATC70_001528 [Mucor velutinosus]|uniref:Uncharacterized protein n=1 Tax=Mucor velutinosus TaxID=708070 RepID=A0AAN7DIN6_9FUNG|nr:hypothetical protein ATC70_001528 [Mucor velutinosus]